MLRKTTDTQFLRQDTPFCSTGWERTQDASAREVPPSWLGRTETISVTKASTYQKGGSILVQHGGHFLITEPSSWYRKKKLYTTRKSKHVISALEQGIRGGMSSSTFQKTAYQPRYSQTEQA